MSIYGTYIQESSSNIDYLVDECSILANNLYKETEFFESLFEANDEFKEVKDKANAKDAIIDKLIKIVEEFKIKLNQFIKTAIPKMQNFVNEKVKDALLPKIEQYKDATVTTKVYDLAKDGENYINRLTEIEKEIVTNNSDKESIDKILEELNNETDGGTFDITKIQVDVKDTVKNIYDRYYSKNVELLSKLAKETTLARSSSELATTISNLKHAKLNNRKNSDEFNEVDFGKEADDAVYRAKILVRILSAKLKIVSSCYKWTNKGLFELVKAGRVASKEEDFDDK